MVHKLKRSMKNIYSWHLSRALISKFLKHVQEFENIYSCLETLKGGNKWGSANSGVGAGDARDVWMWSWMCSIMASPPTLVFDLLIDHRQNKWNMKDKGALPALTLGSQSSQSWMNQNKTGARLDWTKPMITREVLSKIPTQSFGSLVPLLDDPSSHQETRGKDRGGRASGWFTSSAERVEL